MPRTSRNAVIVVAGGEGSRLGALVPKAFVKLGRRPMVWHSLIAFNDHPLIDHIVLVVPVGWEARSRRLVKTWHIEKLAAVVTGGALRQDSVFAGLKALENASVKNVLVHDAARPLISADVITAVARSLTNHAAVVPVVSLKDTPKQRAMISEIATSSKTSAHVGFSVVSPALSREMYLLAQTPQGFDREVLYQALEHAQKHGIHGTDDSMLVELIGKNVQAIMGDDRNIKITTAADLKVAAALLKDHRK